MKIISNLIKIIVIAIILILAYLNMEMVEVTYFFKKAPIKVPLILVFIVGIAIGAILASLISFKDKFKLKREITSLKKKITESENEIKRLRTLPLSKEEKQL